MPHVDSTLIATVQGQGWCDWAPGGLLTMEFGFVHYSTLHALSNSMETQTMAQWALGCLHHISS